MSSALLRCRACEELSWRERLRDKQAPPCCVAELVHFRFSATMATITMWSRRIKQTIVTMKTVHRCHTRSSARALLFSKQRGFGWGPALDYGPNLLARPQGWHLRNACAHASVPSPHPVEVQRLHPIEHCWLTIKHVMENDSMPQSSNNGDHVKLSKMKTVLRVPYLKLCKGRFLFFETEGFGWGPALNYGPNILARAQGWHLWGENACAHASVPSPLPT